MPSCSMCLRTRALSPSTPRARRSIRSEHQAVGRVEDASQYSETVNGVYQKGYRMADRILRSAMVTVTYGGERPAPEPEAAPEDVTADTAEGTEEVVRRPRATPGALSGQVPYDSMSRRPQGRRM